MKFVHLSDLHIGKRVKEFSMIEDQHFILSQILDIIHNDIPDAIIIAGDIYDTAVPTVEATALFDKFITRLADSAIPVFIISGNHDSATRLSFASQLIEKSKIYFSQKYDGHIRPHILHDAYGVVNIYALPFIKPADVRNAFKDEPDIENVRNYNDAMRYAIKRMPIDPHQRNLLIAHQFVTGARLCDSEDLSVGGLDNIDASVFDDFDYVALGHIHSSQNINAAHARLRYCGTPLKYSASEIAHTKSVTYVEWMQKDDIRIHEVPLRPLHDMQSIKGSYETVASKDFYINTQLQDSYLHITLTDSQDIIGAIQKLRSIYPYLMTLNYENKQTGSHAEFQLPLSKINQSPIELFQQFYQMQTNEPMTENQIQYMNKLIEKIWENKE